MEETELQIDEVLEVLNKRPDISRLKIENLTNCGLDPREITFLKLHKPEQSLIVYGTLAPGRQNHSQVEHIKGVWKKAKIKGKVEQKGWGSEFGFPGFRVGNKNNQDDIDAFVFLSSELNYHWQRLDDFEGPEYKRILVKYESEDGKTGVGYIYAINQDNGR